MGGKSSLLRRLVHDEFQSEYTRTMGATMESLRVDLESDAGDPVEANLTLFDVGGTEDALGVLRDPLFHGTHGALVVCDLGRPETVSRSLEWIHAVSRATGGVPFHFALNKEDLGPGVRVGPEEVAWIRQRFPLARMTSTSAKTGEGVGDAIDGLVLRIVSDLLAAGRERRARGVLRQRILMAISQRGDRGLSLTELTAMFHDVESEDVSEETENLVRIDLLSVLETRAKTFVAEGGGPQSPRFRTTKQGLYAAQSAQVHDLVVDEPV